MKICLVIDSLGAGGAEKSTQLWAEYLRARGHSVDIVYFEKRKLGVGEKMMDESLHLVSAGSWPLRLLKLVDTLKKINPDIVHSALFRSNMLLRFSRMLYRKPVALESLVTTPYLNDRFVDTKISPSKVALIKWFDGISAKLLSQYFYAISQYVSKHYIESIGLSPSRVFAIPRGRNKNPFTGSDKTELRKKLQLNMGDNDFLMISVGRHESVKGHINMLKALNILIHDKGKKNLKFILLGRDGSETKELTQYAQSNGLTPYIDFAGYRHDVPEILAASDLFLFLSYYEGLGGALLEAQSAGLPVLCSDIPIFHEVTNGKGVRFVNPTDHGKIAEQMEELMFDPVARVRLGKESLDNFESNYESSHVFSRMYALYDQLTSRHGDRSVQ